MRVALNRESWHYRLFKKELAFATPPSSLCPYFWTIVGLCILTPFLMIGRGFEKISKFISNLIPKRKPKAKPEKTHDEWLKEWNDKREKENIKRQKIDKFGKIFGKIFFGLLFVAAAIALIYSIYMIATGVTMMGFFAAVGIVSVLIGFIVLLIWSVEKYGHYLADWMIRFFLWINPLKWSITKMIGWMIVAGYKKMCPLVEWSGEEIKNEETYQNY